MTSWWRVAKGLLVGVLAIVLYVTNDAFIMVQGSDSTSFLIAPTGTVQLVCIAIVAVALLVTAKPLVRGGGVFIASIAALLGGHRLVIDNLNHEIRDVYLAVPLQSLTLDPAHEGGLEVLPSRMGFRIGQAGVNRGLWCLSPPLVGLDRAELSRAAR